MQLAVRHDGYTTDYRPSFAPGKFLFRRNAADVPVCGKMLNPLTAMHLYIGEVFNRSVASSRADCRQCRIHDARVAMHRLHETVPNLPSCPCVSVVTSIIPVCFTYLIVHKDQLNSTLIPSTKQSTPSSRSISKQTNKSRALTSASIMSVSTWHR